MSESSVDHSALSPPTYLVIGHVTKDLVAGSHQVGGSLTYAAVAAKRLGERVVGVTSFGPDLELAEELADVDLLNITSSTTTTFENLYYGRRRRQFIRAIANSLEPEHVPAAWRNAAIVHLAPIAQEVSPAIADLFPRSFIGITPQGWMRRWVGDGRVRKADWADAERVLRLANAVVLSEDDVIGGLSTIRRYARQTSILVVTRGRDGADLYYRGSVHPSPAFPTHEIDPTGAGDVFAAAFFVKLHRSGDPFLAVRFANCAASFAVEKVGLLGIPTLAQIEQRLAASHHLP